MEKQIKKIGKALCEVCGRMRESCYIVKGEWKHKKNKKKYCSVRCYKHLPDEARKIVDLYYEIKAEKEALMKELEEKKKLLNMLEIAYQKGFEEGIKCQAKQI